jgi:two-component system, sensor histidine kinase and response regulator
MKQEGKQIRYQFLSVLSHELKAPLNAIEGYLRIMHEKQAGDDIASYTQMIERAMDRIQGMRSLVMDLLDFTRIRLEKKEDKIIKVNVRELAKLSASTVKPYAIQKNVEIKIDCPHDLQVEANPNDLEIILNNLISNAVKYNKEGGRVDVIISLDGKILKMVIKDTGIGLTEDEKSQLFHAFVRIRNEKTRHITGSGLGLSIVRKITEIYNGKIEVESEPDKGSTFVISLEV